MPSHHSPVPIDVGENADLKHESVIVTATVPYRDVELFEVAIRKQLPVALYSHSGDGSKEYTDLSVRFRHPVAAGIVMAAVQKAAAEVGAQVIAIVANPQPQPGVMSISGTVDMDALRRVPAKPGPDVFGYEAYWKAFRAALARSGSRLRPPTLGEQNWVRFPTGGGGTRIHAFASTRGRYIGVELVLDRAEQATTFQRLRAERVQIEREIGQELVWKEHEASYRIGLIQPGRDPADAADWRRQHAWFTETLNVFYDVLVKRLDRHPGPVTGDPGSAGEVESDTGGAGPRGESPARAPYDVFISHAHEDKEAVARPLATELRSRGIRVWYDEFALSLGDSLRRSIDRGLAESRFGVVVLSPSFFAKEWPMRELNGLTSRESAGGKVILPLWHGVQQPDVARYSPLLADRLAITTDRGITALADAIIAVITR
jgi:hypothetical protein